MNNNWVWLVAGSVGLYFYLRVRSLTSLQFVARGIGLGNGGIQLKIGVQNPTANQLTVNSLVGQVLVDGNPVGNVSAFMQQVILPNSESEVRVTLTPDIFGLLGQAINILQNGGEAFDTISIQGTANVSGALLPVNLQFRGNE